MPITWRNRRTGEPKLKLTEMGSRYLFVILYVWLEKYFSRGDYRKASPASTGSPHAHANVVPDPAAGQANRS
jgi:dolichol-phosphate mannosyltransferase